jgi:hypothetical protein
VAPGPGVPEPDAPADRLPDAVGDAAPVSAGLSVGSAEAEPVWSGAVGVAAAETDSVGTAVGRLAGVLAAPLEGFEDGSVDGFEDGFDDGCAEGFAVGFLVGPDVGVAGAASACAVAGIPGAVLLPLCHANATYPPSGMLSEAAATAE